MKSFATVFLAFVTSIVAQQQPQNTGVPTPVLNAFQEAALSSLKAAQSSLNALNSEIVAENKASQAAALESQSEADHSHGHHSSHMESMESDMEISMESSVDEESNTSGASAVSGSMVALAFVAGVAMF